MKKKHQFHHLWLILAAYGVWFAIFSGIEEVMSGKFWKVLVTLLFGIVAYIIIEIKLNQ